MITKAFAGRASFVVENPKGESVRAVAHAADVYLYWRRVW